MLSLHVSKYEKIFNIMKKLFLLGTVSLVMGLSACQKDGHHEQTRTITAPTINIISSLDEGDDDVIVSNGFYTFSLVMNDETNTGTVASSDLVANNQILTFTTNEKKYSSTGYDAFFEDVTGTVGNTGMELNNADFLAIYLYDETYNKYGYYYDTTNVGEYTYMVSPVAPWIPVANYNIGNSYKVRTFQKDTFFKGTTTTSYSMGGEVNNFETEGITYRFIIDTEKNSAVFIIYNGKFSASAMEPVKTAIIVEGLKVDFSKTGITITGENLVPDIVEANGVTPNEGFIFNSIQFRTTNDNLTKGEIDYMVAGRYSGHFTGSYMNTYFQP